MESDATLDRPAVNDKAPRLGRPSQSTVLTDCRDGKLSVERSCRSRSWNESSIWDKLSADREDILLLALTVKLPVIRLMPFNAMSSALPVATAMSPE